MEMFYTGSSIFPALAQGWGGSGKCGHRQCNNKVWTLEGVMSMSASPVAQLITRLIKISRFKS